MPLFAAQSVNGPGAWHAAGAEHECGLDPGCAGHGNAQLQTATADSPPERHLN